MVFIFQLAAAMIIVLFAASLLIAIVNSPGRRVGPTVHPDDKHTAREWGYVTKLDPQEIALKEALERESLWDGINRRHTPNHPQYNVMDYRNRRKQKCHSNPITK